MFQSIVATLVFAYFVGAQTSDHREEGMHDHHHSDATNEIVFTGMPSTIFLGVPMSMDGSGTSWIPSDGEAPMKMFHAGEWMVMTHGSLFLRYVSQFGLRPADEFSFPNWYMISAQRPVGNGQQLSFRAMVSADRIFDGGEGYPLLLQSGETWNGKPLIDRQHPHDVFAELSTTFSKQFSPGTGAFLSVGYPGEPAMGPSAFMHRPAARPNPDAPIGHHWQDATHITYGVVTAGAVFSQWKVEASIFTGREPDENRWNFERPRFDSYSGRLSINPSNELSMQASYGFLRDPEGHGDDALRMSASILYSTLLDDDRSFHMSFIWGQNEEHHQALTSLLLESAAEFHEWGVYGRGEIVQKPRGKLGFTAGKETIETVKQVTAGVYYPIHRGDIVEVRLGIQGMLSFPGEFLRSVYGPSPGSVQMYIHLQ